jgi:hypothetical protein
VERLNRGLDQKKFYDAKDISSEMKNELFYGRDQRKYYDFILFAVIDREYNEILNLPEGNNKKSSLSTLIYIIGATIFLLGAIEGLTAAQLTKTSSLSDLQLSGIALLTALISGMIFIGFGKVIELIVYRSNK